MPVMLQMCNASDKGRVVVLHQMYGELVHKFCKSSLGDKGAVKCAVVIIVCQDLRHAADKVNATKGQMCQGEVATDAAQNLPHDINRFARMRIAAQIRHDMVGAGEGLARIKPDKKAVNMPKPAAGEHFFGRGEPEAFGQELMQLIDLRAGHG